jgi:hypothetical protein
MILSVGTLIFQVYLRIDMSSSTRRQQHERDNEYSSDKQQQQQEATIRSIDMTKDNIRRSIEEVRRETPRYSQAVTDFQNETADASVEIADNFLESQKKVINSVQSAWAPMAERIGQVAHYWTTTGMTPFFSPREMIDIYARTMGAMAEAYVTSTRMATNMMFAGMEATKATTNYTRQNAKKRHVLLQIQPEHLPRLQKKQFKFRTEKVNEDEREKKEEPQSGVEAASVVMEKEKRDQQQAPLNPKEDQLRLLQRGLLILAKA